MFNRNLKCTSVESDAQNKILPPVPKYIGYQLIKVRNLQLEKDYFFSVLKKSGRIALKDNVQIANIMTHSPKLLN